MENWYQKSIDALQVNGMAKRTQVGYTRAVRLLTEHYDKTPEILWGTLIRDVQSTYPSPIFRPIIEATPQPYDFNR